MMGHELRAIRERLGLTQVEFAQRLGITATFLGLMERGRRGISVRTEMSARAMTPPSLGIEPTSTDPMERLVEEALIEAGVPYVSDFQGNESRLDFELPTLGLAIEVKRFHSERASEQLKRAPNVILAQGEAAVRALAEMIRSGGLTKCLLPQHS